MKKRKLYTLIMVILIGILTVGCSSSNKDTTTSNQGNNNNDEKYLSKETEKSGNDENPIATIEMEDGDIIKLELYPEIAPNTVRNFISLANSNFYNGTIFHRVIKGFMIQGGDPEGTGMGGPDYSIYGEFSKNKFPNDLKHEKGVISMARANDKNSAGSQFFIMHEDTLSLNRDYSAFGNVFDGMDVVDKIAAVPTDEGEWPLENVYIKSVRIIN